MTEVLTLANQRDFESATPQGWAANTASTAIATSTTVAHAGARSLRLQNTSGASSTIRAATTTPNAFPAGSVCTLECWGRSGGGYRTFRMNIRFADDLGWVGDMQPITTENYVDGPWTRVGGSINAPAEATYAQVYLEVLAAAAGELHYFDDVSFDASPLPVIGEYGLLGLLADPVVTEMLPDATDRQVHSTSATYATARAGGVLTIGSAAAEAGNVGQVHDNFSGYLVYQAQLPFYIGEEIGWDRVVTAAELDLTFSGGLNQPTDSTFHVYDASEIPDAFVGGATLAGLPILGSFTVAEFQGVTRATVGSGAGLVAAVNERLADGTPLRLIVAAEATADDVTPGNNYSSPVSFGTVWFGEAAVTARRPILRLSHIGA